MKRRILMVLAALLLFATPALAEQGAELTLLEDRFLVLPSYNELFEGVLSAKIQNTGNVTLQVEEGLYELLDKDGVKLKDCTWVPLFPGTLEPGQVGYLYVSECPDDVKTADGIASHTLDLKASTNVYQRYKRMEATARVAPPRSSYSELPYLEATVVNATEAAVYDITVVFAVYDSEDKLLYVQENTAYNAGVPAGGTILIGEDLDRQVKEYLDANEMTISRVDVIAFIDVR